MTIIKFKKLIFSQKGSILRFKIGISLILAIFLLELSFPQLILAQTIRSKAQEIVIKPALRGGILKEAVTIDLPPDYQVKKSFNLVTTAYSSTVDQTDSTPFITALGTEVRDGIVAANFLDFGTKIRFPEEFGDKIFVVEDRMNHRYRKRVDIWMASREQALDFGAKYLKIEVLE